MAASASFQRVTAIALVVLVLVLAWRGVVAPLWRAWRADAELISERREAIARMRGMTAGRARIEAALGQARQAAGREDALMASPSSTLAAADLQQRVKSLVEEAGGSLVSAQPTDPGPAGPFTRIGLNVRLVISTPSLQRVLHALETRSPLVVIDEMLVLSRGARASRRRTESTDTLDVRLQLVGFMAADTSRGNR